ncbi:MAG: methylenetetrahydrofolate reductase [Deltaproteobacteria bacterium]|nr:MAG: methylenetetrahydrofolate reductase [Deltaproteobacteria bacterium]
MQKCEVIFARALNALNSSPNGVGSSTMLRVFQNDLFLPEDFITTLELVPGKDSSGRSVDTVMGIARDSFSDGGLSAVSITDNPGGNPSLSPDVLGHDIFKVGMDVIVHFTCRDLNRVGMESRALQLSMMGMKNLLALTGDYTGKGFGGQGAPVFDLDAVNLLMMLDHLSHRFHENGDPDGFFAGCAVSPFKYTEAECFAQYAKLCRKISAGARFIITQLGYDARKFAELITVLKQLEVNLPVFGSIYLLTPRSARIMNKGMVPGVVVTDKLLTRVLDEWKNPKAGRVKAIERAAKLGAILKGLGYQGMHLGGIHKTFDVAGDVMSHMKAIQDQWQSFLPEFEYPVTNGFYVFPDDISEKLPANSFGQQTSIPMLEKIHFRLMKSFHNRFFSFESKQARTLEKVCGWIDHHRIAEGIVTLLENSAKKILLGCQHCGDCGIQNLAFLCPESRCPKHTRNGACGGSSDGKCEVRTDRNCVWVRTYRRMAYSGTCQNLLSGCVPPRMWELNQTSSWLNFHLKRDHQSVSTGLEKYCRLEDCQLSFCEHYGKPLNPKG